jgi:predicted nicotinamide N-methyase
LHDDLIGNSCDFSVTCGARQFAFRRPASPDALLDEISDEQYEKDKFLPYWAEYWPSSEALLQALSSLLPATGSLICELGTGLGVIAAIAASQGHRVVATDISYAACRYAAENARVFGRVLPLCTDWRYPAVNGRFDVVLGADILYEERWIDPVLRFLEAHLCEQGWALIADPCRRHWGRFLEQAQRSGWQVDIVHRAAVNSGRTTVEIAALSAEAV